MNFVYVTNQNFEDIFEVSAKYEQWKYVNHQIFDMVDNYAAIVNETYLPIPFLVYENEKPIGFVQVNYDESKSSCEICKLIVQETEQDRGYGTKILSEMIKWVCIQFESGTITAGYKADNMAAHRLLLKAGFRRQISGENTAAVMETGIRESGPREREAPESVFEEIPYRNVREFTNQIKALKKYPQSRIGEEKGIHFRRASMDDCRQIAGMQLLESQEEYVMPFVDSLAQSYSDLFEDEITVSYALCHGEKPVGLVEIYYGKGRDFPNMEGKQVYELFRILVDRDCQMKGYGTEAVRLFLDYAKGKFLGEAEDIVVSVVEGNDVALKLYEKFGFAVFGRDKYGHTALKRSCK